MKLTRVFTEQNFNRTLLHTLQIYIIYHDVLLRYLLFQSLRTLDTYKPHGADKDKQPRNKQSFDAGVTPYERTRPGDSHAKHKCRGESELPIGAVITRPTSIRLFKPGVCGHVADYPLQRWLGPGGLLLCVLDKYLSLFRNTGGRLGRLCREDGVMMTSLFLSNRVKEEELWGLVGNCCSCHPSSFKRGWWWWWWWWWWWCVCVCVVSE